MGIWLFWVMILVFSIVLFIVLLKGNGMVIVSLFVKAIDMKVVGTVIIQYIKQLLT